MTNSLDPQHDPAVDRRSREYLQFLIDVKAPPLETLAPQEARELLAKAQRAFPERLPDCDVSDLEVHHDSQHLRLTIVKPKNVPEPLPAFMFFHGGGWVIGDYATHERLVRELVAASGCAAVFVDYDLSPEVRFPVALEQCYAATCFIADHGAEFGLDGSRLAVVGNSAGGNMATVVARLARDRVGPKLRAQILMWPNTDATSVETDSHRHFAKGYALTQAMMLWFMDQYVPEKSLRTDSRISPILAPIDELRGLPPALIQTCEADPLRDDGETYAARLDEAGVDVVSTRYLGVLHDWATLNYFAEHPATRAAIEQVATEIKRRLS